MAVAIREQEIRLPEEVQKRLSTNTLTVADVTAMFFIRNGMQRFYNISGSTIVRTTNAMNPYIEEGYATSIIAGREDGAVFAAGGEAFITGQPGVAFLIGGPGLGNAHTAIYALARERLPLVIATGQVPSWEIGTGAFQDYPSDKIIPPLGSLFHRLEDPMEILSFVDNGFNEAHLYQTTVVLEIPKDKQDLHFDRKRLEEYLNSSSNRKWPDRDIPLSEQDEETVRYVADLINNANKPLFVFGHRFGQGIDSAETKAMVAWLAENGDIPYTVDYTALHYSQPNHPLYIGRGGKAGNPRVDQAMKSADLVVGWGTKFDEGSVFNKRAANPDIFSPQATIVSIDNLAKLPPELQSDTSKNPRVNIFIHTNPLKAAKILASLLRDKARTEWLKQASQSNLTVTPDESSLSPRQRFLSQFSKIAQSNAHFVVDAGNTTADVAKILKLPDSRFLSSLRETGTMGFAPAFALGAKIANPKTPVYVLMGDRSLLMSSELPTITGASINGQIPGQFGITVFDDAGHGALRGEPNNGNPSCTDVPYPPNISMLFSAHGINNETVEASNANAAITRMCTADKPHGLWVPIPQYPLRA